MRRFRGHPCVSISVAFCFVLTSPVSAATVTVVSGKISLNRGDGFAQISQGTAAKPGDLVMAGVSGRAEIVYDDGCRQKVEPGSVIAVAATSPCQRATASPKSDWVTETAEAPKPSVLPYVLGAVAIGGIAAVAVAAGGGGGSGGGDAGGGSAGGGPASP
jgi:hypothetical protein